MSTANSGAIGSWTQQNLSFVNYQLSIVIFFGPN
jgi:hypothetical protein